MFWSRHLTLVHAGIPRSDISDYQEELCPVTRDHGLVAGVEGVGDVVDCHEIWDRCAVAQPGDLQRQNNVLFVELKILSAMLLMTIINIVLVCPEPCPRCWRTVSKLFPTQLITSNKSVMAITDQSCQFFTPNTRVNIHV